MTYYELQKIKEAAARFKLECNTPEKARAHLIKIGYINDKDEVIERTS
jgi:hypothetical protein